MSDLFQDHTSPITNKSPEAGSGDKKYMLSGAAVNAQNTRTHNPAERFSEISVKNTELSVKNTEKAANKPAAINFTFPPNPDPKPSLSPVIKVNLTPPAVNGSTGAAAGSSDVRRQTRYISSASDTVENKGKIENGFLAQESSQVSDGRGEDTDKGVENTQKSGKRLKPRKKRKQERAFGERYLQRQKRLSRGQRGLGGDVMARVRDSAPKADAELTDTACNFYRGRAHRAKQSLTIANGLKSGRAGHWQPLTSFLESTADKLLRCKYPSVKNPLRFGCEGGNVTTYGSYGCGNALCISCREVNRNQWMGVLNKVNRIFLAPNFYTETKKGEKCTLLRKRKNGVKWREVNFLTLTIPRELKGVRASGKGMDLLREALRILHNGGKRSGAGKIKDALDWEGWFRHSEPTFGVSGIHYHIHTLVWRDYWVGSGSDLNELELSRVIWEQWNKAVKKAVVNLGSYDFLEERIANGEDVVKKPYWDGKNLKGGAVCLKCNKFGAEEAVAYILKTGDKGDVSPELATKVSQAVDNDLLTKASLEVASSIGKVRGKDWLSMNAEEVFEHRFSYFELPELVKHSDKRVVSFAYDSMRQYAVDMYKAKLVEHSYVMVENNDGSKSRSKFIEHILKEAGEVEDEEVEAEPTVFFQTVTCFYNKMRDSVLLDKDQIVGNKHKKGSFYPSGYNAEEAKELMSRQSTLRAQKIRVGRIRKDRGVARKDEDRTISVNYTRKLGACIFEWFLAKKIFDPEVGSLEYSGVKEKRKLDLKLYALLRRKEDLRNKFCKFSKSNRKIKSYSDECFLSDDDLILLWEKIRDQEREIEENAFKRIDTDNKLSKNADSLGGVGRLDLTGILQTVSTNEKEVKDIFDIVNLLNISDEKLEKNGFDKIISLAMISKEGEEKVKKNRFYVNWTNSDQDKNIYPMRDAVEALGFKYQDNMGDYCIFGSFKKVKEEFVNLSKAWRSVNYEKN